MGSFNFAKWIMAVGLVTGLLSVTAAHADNVEILNVSYDVSREFYQDFNAAFSRFWQAKTGQAVTINQSHGGASKQSRAVVDGMEADVVTMNQQTDIDLLVANGKVKPDWRSRFPYDSAPYTSTIVFLVRKGNPKGIKDWDDLVKPGIGVIIPNPKTSGNGRYSYLAAWGYALKKFADEQQAQTFVSRLFKNVPMLDTGGRAATTTFIQRGIGDALLTFENEVLLITRQFNPDAFEVVIPSLSIIADAPVAIVDSVVDKRGTRQVAEAYLDYLYSEEAQRLIAKHYFRPRLPKVTAEYATFFAPLKLFSVDEVFGGWQKAQQAHFADSGTFDKIYLPGG